MSKETTGPWPELVEYEHLPGPVEVQRYRPEDPLALPPLSGSITAGFRPYYQRAKKGDLNALIEYFVENYWTQEYLDQGFYACVGYLVASPFEAHQKIVARIISLVTKRKKQEPLEIPAKVAIAKRLIRVLSPQARQVKTWIKNLRERKGWPARDMTPIALWRHYQREVKRARSLIRATAHQKQRPGSLFDLYMQGGNHLVLHLSSELFCTVTSTAPE